MFFNFYKKTYKNVFNIYKTDEQTDRQNRYIQRWLYRFKQHSLSIKMKLDVKPLTTAQLAANVTW